MQFCEKVIDCILNDPDVQQAIADEMLADGPMRDAINQVAQKGSPLTSGQSGGSVIDGCDLDELFAGITSIVDTMHNNNKDFLEVMALAATQTKRLSTAISAIPVIGLLPADEIVDWVGKLQAEVLTNYDAEWTTDVKDAYRCGLFCIARSHDDCTLSYDDIYNYIQSRLGAALDPLHLLESIVQYTILGTWSGTTVVDIMMLNQISIWKVAGQWLGSVIRTLETVAALGKDTPDPDWMILCTDCPETCADFTVSGSAGGWVSVENPASYLWGQHFNTHGWSSSHGGSTIDAPVTNTTLWIQPSTQPSGTLTIRLTFSASVPAATIKSSYEDGGSVLGTSSGSGTEQTISGIDATNGISLYIASYPDGVYLEMLCYI